MTQQCTSTGTPTWTRVISVATTIGILLAANGCNFEHYNYAFTATDASSDAKCGDAGTLCGNSSPSTGGASGSTGGASGSTGGSLSTDCGGDAGTHCELACTISTDLDGGYPSSLVAHWTFDGDGNTWLNSESPGHNLQVNIGYEAAQMRYSKARINGKGNSIYLNGSLYAYYVGDVGDAGDPLFQSSAPSQLTPDESGFTVSAYISMEPDRLDDAGAPSARVMPIVSTMSKESCGYQLDLRWNQGDTYPSLAFSYGYRPTSSTGNVCQINKLEYPLTMPSAGPLNAWRMGQWHQLAGIYAKNSGSGLATLKLYWDGNLVANSAERDAGAAPPIYYNVYALNVGANLENTQWFKGYLDEIAIFNQPLNDPELADFVRKSTTRPGPSQCRWQAQELWDDVAPDASTAAWQSDSTTESPHIIVDDNNWGAGWLQAALTPPKDLRYYSTVYLDATVQSDKVFQFQITNSDGFCDWLFLGTGSRQMYTVDLSRPFVCYTRGCEFKLDVVESIQVSSAWSNPPFFNSAPDNSTRSSGPVDITVHSLAFDLGGNRIPDWSAYGGAIGLNGWCWRPISFDLLGGSEWASTPSSTSVSVNVTGVPQTTTRIAADFGDNLYHLPDSACLLIDASASIPGENLEFSIQDIVGSSRNWEIYLTSLNASSPCMLHLVNPAYSTERHEYPFENFPNAIDLNSIKYLAIQKPFQYNTGKDSVNITIRDITIYPDDGQNCQRLANNVRDCTVKPL